jgi:hypothetical protein
MSITHKNHYVPCMYLKRFADPAGCISEYRLLVSRQRVKQWKQVRISAVGYKRDLYTRCVLGTETDEVEKWLDQGFEHPADGPIGKVQRDEQLEASDWGVLVRFLASQIVRTPAFFIGMQPTWDKMMPGVLENSMRDVKEKLQRARDTGEPPPRVEHRDPAPIPLRVHREDVPEEGIAKITVEVLMGRSLWHNSMRHMLTSTVKVLLEHRWSILLAGFGLQFFTSDDPVVRLNYHSESQFDFNGGWGSVGTEIFLPLTPRHLLYTKVGSWSEPRGIILSDSETHNFRQMIARHAHRSIFALTQDSGIPQLRPRIVNARMVIDEEEQWRRWHEEQNQAEAKLMSDPPPSKGPN